MDSPRSEQTQWFSTELAPHESALRAYLHSLVNPSEVDDLVQETYVRVLRAHERGPITPPRTLLFDTARNAARDLFRRRHTANTIPITESVASRVFDGAPNAAETASRQLETDLLATAIAELPPRCREILVLPIPLKIQFLAVIFMKRLVIMMITALNLMIPSPLAAQGKSTSIKPFEIGTRL